MRIKNFRTWADVQNATRHGRREDPARHVDRTKTDLNLHWAIDAEGKALRRQVEGADLRDCMERIGEARGAKWRKGAAVGTEMLWIASPDHFTKNGPAGSAAWAEDAKRWATDCLKATAEKYPGMIAAARLDLDETTPHLSVFLVPIYEKPPQSAREGSKEAEALEVALGATNAPDDAVEAALSLMAAAQAKRSRRKPRIAVSAGAHFGSRSLLSDLQTWAANQMQSRGHALERGEPKATKGRDYTTPETGRARIKAAEQEAAEIIRAAKAEASTIIEKAQEDRRRLDALWQAIQDLLPGELIRRVQERFAQIISPKPEQPPVSRYDGPGR